MSDSDKATLGAIGVIVAILFIFVVIDMNQCDYPGCHNAPWDASGYCTVHSESYKAIMIYEQNHPKNGSSSYGNNSYGSYGSSTTQKKSNGSTTTSSSSPYGKKKSSMSKVGRGMDMPDCDDYDDLEDFLDDWEGCMPDGSDAEDYWDNW